MNPEYELWVDIYQEAYINGNVSGLACPSCDALELKLVFTVRNGPERGEAAMWCENCLRGIVMAPVLIPQHADRVAHATANIPNFEIIPP